MTKSLWISVDGRKVDFAKRLRAEFEETAYRNGMMRLCDPTEKDGRISAPLLLLSGTTPRLEIAVWCRAELEKMSFTVMSIVIRRELAVAMESLSHWPEFADDVVRWGAYKHMEPAGK